MQLLKVSDSVRLIKWSLGVKWLINTNIISRKKHMYTNICIPIYVHQYMYKNICIPIYVYKYMYNNIRIQIQSL